MKKIADISSFYSIGELWLNKTSSTTKTPAHNKNNTLISLPSLFIFNLLRFFTALGIVLTLAACGGGGGGGEKEADNNAGVLNTLFSDYAVTFTGRVGGPYEPSGSIVSGTTAGVVNFSKVGSITLSASEPGVIGVPAGTTIPGVAPQDVIFGAAVIQNPLRVFIGTIGADSAGDFGTHSMVSFGVPAGSPNITEGCSKISPFSCSPQFLQRADNISGSVNLIYFVIDASGDTNTVTIRGTLLDRHTAEAAAANLFSVPIESPILGNLIDSFIFSKSATFEMTISGNRISGQITGQGVSAASLVPQTAIFEVSFDGTKI